MASVTHTLLNPGLQPLVDAHVEVTLMAPDAEDDAYREDKSGVAGPWVTSTDVDGTWLVDDITPNDEIEPDGTVYRVVHRPRVGPRQEVFFVVPSDGATPVVNELRDLLTDPPTGLVSVPLQDHINDDTVHIPVDLTGISDGDILVWDAGTETFRPEAP